VSVFGESRCNLQSEYLLLSNCALRDVPII
jgi:hypothetical protein